MCRNKKSEKMTIKNIAPAEGKLLIAEPSLLESYFNRSIVLLADHNENGSFGIIINKPTDYKVNDIIKSFPEFESDIYIGGPLKTDNLFVIHSLGKAISNSIKIAEGVYWGGDFELITNLCKEKKIAADQIRFCVGYAGWTPNQLELEIKEKSWVVAETTSEEIFKTPHEKLWPNKMKSLGYEHAIWANLPSNPFLN
jgi:putative transcriptional regulator